MKKMFAVTVALAAAASFAGSYKWTGAVSSDFADAGNWLVQSGDEWVATETPPENAHCKDDVVFDGDASSCLNMPVLNQNYTVYRIFFRTGGWFLTVNDGYSLSLVHGSGGWGQGDENGFYETDSIVDTSASGKTNTVSGTISYHPGCSFSVSEGSVLNLDVALSLSSSGYSGSQRQVKFSGAGAVVLTKAGFPSSAESFYVNGTTLVMDVAGANAISGKSLYLKDAQVKALQAGQLGSATIYLSGSSSIDFGGFKYTGNLFLGAASSNASAEWTGSLQNVGDLQMGGNDTGYAVSPTSHQIVLDSKVDGHRKWQGYNEGNKIKVGDIPNVAEELIFNGPICGNATASNKYGSSIYFNGLEIDGETTYGSVSLNAATGFGGIYTRAFISTTLYVNHTTEESSSLGNPLTIKVNPGTGILRGDGVVTPYAGDANQAPAVNVYGTLSPGSVSNPAGTLAFQRSGDKTHITVTMRTNSVFRIEADANGDCPKVVQNDGTFALEQPPEGAEETIVAPAIVIGGKYVPAPGWHRVLTVKGTMTGTFSGVSAVEFEDAAKCRAMMRTVVDETTGETHVEVKIGKGGLTIFIR